MPPDSESTQSLHQQLISGKISSEQLVRRCLGRIDARNEEIHAFVHVDADDAIAQAVAIDNRRAAGETIGLLAGIPVALKDNLCCKGQPATCCSRILENFRPPYDADVVSRIRAADGVLLGRTNLDEFAMGSSTENSAVVTTRNPHDTSCVPGGSSGGSAAAVADGMVPLALGSDTGGSIRQPAAFCGIHGLKPTYGRVSRYGLIAFASSLDQIGPFANDVYGVSLLLQVIAGHSGRDTTSVDHEVPDFLSRHLDSPPRPLRIGFCPEHFAHGLSPDVETPVRAAIDLLRDAGAEIVEVSLPHSRYSVAAYYVIAPSEASSNLARYDGVHYGRRAEAFDGLVDLYSRSRGEGFGDEVKRRIMLGTFALSSGYVDQYYNKALKVRRRIREDFDAAFEAVDVVLTPTSPTTAFRIGEESSDPLTMYLNDIYTAVANLAGLPGISIPCGTAPSGLPVGMQLMAPPFEELRLLQAAAWYQSLRNNGPLS